MKTIITLIVLVALAFYGGMQYGLYTSGNVSVQSGAVAKILIPPARSDFKNVLGEVLSAKDSVLTLRVQDNSSSTVSVTATTTISKNMLLELSDLKPGFKVVASGVVGKNGLFTASFINVVQDQVQVAPNSTSTKK